MQLRWLFLCCFALLNCSLVAEVQVSNGSYLRKAAVRRFSLKQALSLQPAWSLHHLNLVAGFSWGSLSHLLCKLPSTLKADSSFLDLDALFHKSNHLIPVKHRWPVSFVVESWLRHYMSWRAVDCSVVAAIDNAAASVLTFFFFCLKQKTKWRLLFLSTEPVVTPVLCSLGGKGMLQLLPFSSIQGWVLCTWLERSTKNCFSYI